MRLRFIPLLSGRRRMTSEVPLRTPSPWVTLSHRLQSVQNEITGCCKTRASTRATECDTKGFIGLPRHESVSRCCLHGQSGTPRRKPYNDRINRVPISDYPFLKPQPIGTAVQSFVIPRVGRSVFQKLGQHFRLLGRQYSPKFSFGLGRNLLEFFLKLFPGLRNFSVH